MAMSRESSMPYETGTAAPGCRNRTPVPWRARRAAAWGAAVLTGAAFLTGCGARSDQHAAGQAVAAVAPTAPETSAGRQPAADMASAFSSTKAYLEKSEAATFSGMLIDHDAQGAFEIVVYRPGNSTRNDAEIRDRLKGFPVVFRDAPYSLATLSSVAGALNADHAYWAAHGVKTGVAVPTADGSAVVVDCSTPVDAAMAAFQARYGANAEAIQAVAGEPGGGVRF